MKKSVWGWLYPLKDEFTSLELKKDEYTVGKDPGCSYVITEKQLDRYDYSVLAKKQFRILKKKDGVYLEDIGGTFINNRKVRDGEKVMLNHNDSIAIARINIKVFVFLEKSLSEASAISLHPDIGDKFHVSYKLGQGGFGEVSLAFEKETGKRFAIKTVKKKPTIVKYARTEAAILGAIHHPCIIMTRQVVDTQSVLFIVMEMMDGGDLLRRVHSKSLTEANTKLIFFQLVQAIEYLHNHNIVHRDIKPENVLLASRNNDTLIKVTDFGVSKILTTNTVMDTQVGTPMYIAPEIKKNLQLEYTKQVDVWSLGVLLYFCLSGTLPFHESLRSYMVSFTHYKWSSIAKSAVTLIKSMLQVNPAQRITVKDILAHDWLKDEVMRRQAHQLMWPGKPYVAAASPALALAPATRRKISLPEQSNRFKARGVLEYMSQRKPGTPASEPQLIRANINHQPVRQNALFPPRSPLANSIDKPSGSPLEKKPLVFAPPLRYEARALPQLQKFEPKPLTKPYVSPYAKQQNILPSQQKYVSPINKNAMSSLSQPKLNIKPASPINKKPIPLSPQVKYEAKIPKPSPSPVERPRFLYPPQQKFESKPNVSPIDKRPFVFSKEEPKNAAARPFALNKK